MPSRTRAVGPCPILIACSSVISTFPTITRRERDCAQIHLREHGSATDSFEPHVVQPDAGPGHEPGLGAPLDRDAIVESSFGNLSPIRAQDPAAHGVAPH